MIKKLLFGISSVLLLLVFAFVLTNPSSKDFKEFCEIAIINSHGCNKSRILNIVRKRNYIIYSIYIIKYECHSGDSRSYTKSYVGVFKNFYKKSSHMYFN